ncbi:c-type cytochrome [Rivibacter subsaxonicus]|uniref:Mono/diheme cytochrome c family protein n=1 Tax=Rivibacter subsaxonicus TaxID=457575 RepID=A0A4Q7W1C0_9BURK|nr:cytochrome c [Rivibacter subsaxonicus]RZU03062.1 mono/diheme cytochrome c family protein [Rivibacter subsaxonicus]
MDLRAAALTLLLGAALPGGAVAQQAPAADAAARVELGRRTYTGTCARCHGLNLVTSGIGFDLRTFPQNDRERFERSVTQGLRAMPALGGALTPEQLDALWAYIGAVNGWKP